MRLALSLGVLVAWAGCEGYGATPAELSKPQILGIRADPPAILPGQSSTLSILVADPDGPAANPEVMWEPLPGSPDEPPLGTVTVGQDGEVIYTAPDAVPEPVVYATVMARVPSASGDLVALKAIAVGDESFSNPVVVAFTADGNDVLTSRSLTLTPGQTVTLSVDIGADMDEMTTFAWYATSGTIEQYRSNPIELVAREEPGPGWLFAVVRNGLGGIAWEAIEVTVE